MAKPSAAALARVGGLGVLGDAGCASLTTRFIRLSMDFGADASLLESPGLYTFVTIYKRIRTFDVGAREGGAH